MSDTRGNKYQPQTRPGLACFSLTNSRHWCKFSFIFFKGGGLGLVGVEKLEWLIRADKLSLLCELNGTAK